MTNNANDTDTCAVCGTNVYLNDPIAHHPVHNFDVIAMTCSDTCADTFDANRKAVWS